MNKWTTLIVVGFLTSTVASADARSALQVTPDGKRTLVHKDVGGDRWAISRSTGGTVTGNVYPQAGGEPSFLWCAESARTSDGLTLACSGAGRCTSSPCFASEWASLGEVALSSAFFEPRAEENGGSLGAAPSGDPAPSGLQIAPDQGLTLISKDVGADRWALTHYGDDSTVTGIVFPRFGSSPPQFFWCEEVEAGASDVDLSCFEAEACDATCEPSDWQPIGAVTLPALFFEPPANFANFESTSVHPVRVSVDGSRLYAVHTPDNRLSVFDLSNPSEPTLVREVTVGLEPVSVTERTSREVWVANVLSDSVSVVDPTDGRVIDVLRVPDEPSDVAFAGGKAFVSVAMRDEVQVFDAVTRKPLDTIAIFGKEPRALATSADGGRVFVLVHRSGNGTTILPHFAAPEPLPPTNSALPPAPGAGLIVRADDPVWADRISFTMPDLDVFEIDVTTHEVLRAHAAVGTINFDLAVHPESGDLIVSNTDAHNLVQFEPELRGRFFESRVSRIEATSGAIRHVDLNPGLATGVLTGRGMRAQGMADVGGIALDAEADVLYVASQGTDRIGVYDLESERLRDRIDIGDVSGSAIDTPSIRGPRGLALHPSGRWLYVHNRLSDTLSVVDTRGRRVATEVALGRVDPVPSLIREGRKFLYDAKRGNGTVSCASCHVDADADNLLWDLGDPGGDLAVVPPEVRFDAGEYPEFHPMKGPMVTQTLRGLVGVGPLHWRGDKKNFQAFNPAFDGLMGGEPLSDEEMDLFAAWSQTVHYPPNPNQRLDRGLRNDVAASEQAGFDLFSDPTSPGRCGQCHPVGTGTVGLVRRQPLLETQPIKIAQLRNVYRKLDLDRSSTEPQKIGFSINHEGAGGIGGSFASVVEAGVRVVGREELAPHLIAFLKVWDTGTAPILGRQARLDATTAGSDTLASDLALLEARAAAGDIDLVVLGTIDGVETGLLYEPGRDLYERNTSDIAPTTSKDLVARAARGRARLVFMGAFPGTGKRMALDRNGDGVLDGDQE